ncbi:hypothetical protein C0J52_24971, partial [Blattella germanica]
PCFKKCAFSPPKQCLERSTRPVPPATASSCVTRNEGYDGRGDDHVIPCSVEHVINPANCPVMLTRTTRQSGKLPMNSGEPVSEKGSKKQHVTPVSVNYIGLINRQSK